MLAITEQNRRWWILGAAAGVLGLTVLDETIVGVALVTIRAELSMSEVASHWVVNAYLLTFTCFVAVGGRLGDLYGRGNIFILGATVFGLASLACGLSASGPVLIAMRALQGIGAAVLFPNAIAMVTDAFPIAQRGVAIGIQTTVAAVMMSAGPLLGGVFTQTLSWRWIFWINLPVVIAVALAVKLAWSPEPTSARAGARSLRSIDYRGLITLVSGLCALVIALMQGADWGWGSLPTISLLVAGVILIVGFVILETRISQPLIEVALLRIATFTGGNLVFSMFQFNKIAVIVFAALYLQHALNMTPIAAGTVLLVAIVPTIATSLLAGTLADKYGSRRPLLVALLLNGGALIMMGTATGDGHLTFIIAPLIVWGATLPVLAVPARRALMNAVPAEQRGQAGGVNVTIQMLGGTVGLALSSAVLLVTGDYGTVFLMTGGLTIATMLAVWLLIERGVGPGTPSESPKAHGS